MGVQIVRVIRCKDEDFFATSTAQDSKSKLRTWEAINGNSLPSPMDSHRLLAGFNYHERLLT
jgi:hypothetical protein